LDLRSRSLDERNKFKTTNKDYIGKNNEIQNEKSQVSVVEFETELL